LATYLVTGSNCGIGLEYCKQLRSSNHEVIATCRQTSKDLDKLDVQIIQGIDIALEVDRQRLTSELKEKKIDVFISNAGIYENNNLLDLDIISISRQFNVNALAPLALVKELMSNFMEGSKIILMSSRMGSIEDNTSGGSYGYRMSKVALTMAGRSLSVDLKPYGIAVAVLHPGLVSTRMTAFTPHGISPEKSVQGLINRIDKLNINNSGCFWHSNGECLPW